MTTLENIFKNKRPVKAVKCPIHERPICIKYTQPERSTPFKPIHKYQLPGEPFPKDTVYELSYRPFGPKTLRSCRPNLAAVKGNIALACDSLSGDTTTSLSYVWNYQPPPEPFKPIHKPLPCAPLAQMTTTRHDFPPKPTLRTEPIKPQGNFSPICSKMDDRTVTMNSFLPVEANPPPRSYKPIQTYQEPEVPLESKTITQQSFMCPGPAVREIPPWLPSRDFVPPETPMEGDTIYNGSYQPPGSFERCCSDLSPFSREGDVCLCGIATATEDL